MHGTIRTFDVGVREELHSKLRRMVNSIAEANGATPIARILAYNTRGTEPKKLFWAPKLGTEALLKDNGLTVDDIEQRRDIALFRAIDVLRGEAS